ncbi:MAG: tRNA (adenosine(37)-N6)-threonylcarbamoyltransferase complex ATPase subunit type 1 TsaE [Clostridia bacterium]|nr:tRNA (adenosine(37)-N6)-threonylcarbamoyltransferase complex ATPase subunit type 1 TsaE [Clostridia bacterium]MBQ7048516.1 tRNA (adenosine(37)-N6)-threonylcarbamoyltransferase complex ATPase subunit type 1 TsaE [Clostridia bacterium]
MAEKCYYSKSEKETEDIAFSLAEGLSSGDTLALYGEMGAGKTAFVRGLVKKLLPQCTRLVHSPTFAIVNEYRGEEYSVYHFDFYRIKDEEDLYSVAFYDYFDRGGIIITEWSELFDDLLPQNKKTVRIEKDGEEGRRIYADFSH